MASYLFVFRDPFGVGALTKARHTNCIELDNMFCQRDKLKHAGESLPLKGSIQGSNNHGELLVIGHFLAKLDNVREELALVNAYDIIVVKVDLDVAAFGGAQGLQSLLIMSCNGLLVVPNVFGVFYNQAIVSGYLVPLEPSDQLG